jgi:hypothetical protein
MKKQQIYTTFISLCGIGVFGISVYQSIALFTDPQTSLSMILFSAVMLVIMLLCHMLPIYITSDKTMEISFVAVIACVVTKGVALSIVLFALSTVLALLQDTKTRKYYSPWARAPLKELFNVSNVLVSNWIGGILYNWIVPDAGGEVFAWRVMIGAVVFSCVAIFVNLVFFILYYKLSEGCAFLRFWDNIGGILPNIVATIPLGLLIGYILTQTNAYLWLVLFMAPLMLARYCLKSIWTATRFCSAPSRPS